jgi:hypothetical protein
MPAERKQAFGFDRFDGDFEGHPLVWFLGLCHLGINRGRTDDAAHDRTLLEGAVELDAKPVAELLGIDERAPHSCTRSSQGDLLLDPVGDGSSHMQPLGCPYYTATARLATIWLQMSPSPRLWVNDDHVPGPQARSRRDESGYASLAEMEREATFNHDYLCVLSVLRVCSVSLQPNESWLSGARTSSSSPSAARTAARGRGCR